jgi:hypothetical protein
MFGKFVKRWVMPRSWLVVGSFTPLKIEDVSAGDERVISVRRQLRLL